MVNMNKPRPQTSVLDLKINSTNHAIETMNFYGLSAVERISFIVGCVTHCLGAVSRTITLKVAIGMWQPA